MKPFCAGCLKPIVFLDSAVIVREGDGRFAVYHSRGCLRKHRGPIPPEPPTAAESQAATYNAIARA